MSTKTPVCLPILHCSHKKRIVCFMPFLLHGDIIFVFRCASLTAAAGAATIACCVCVYFIFVDFPFNLLASASI